MLDLLNSPATLVSLLIALIVAATIHEFAHAYVADRLGDPTPRAQGRLTLNPLAHLDPIGSLMILLFGFGYAKLVQINPANFADWRRGSLVVAAAGPLANVTLALFLGAPYKAGLLEWNVTGGDPLSMVLMMTIRISAVLAIFNLIPVPPLDGSKILVAILPPAQAIAYSRLQPYGVLIIVIFLWLPRIANELLDPPIHWLIQQAVGRF